MMTMSVRDASVEEIVSHDVVTVEPEQDLDEAAALMAGFTLRRLSVLEDRRLFGIVAHAGVALEAREPRVGEMVEQISRPSWDDFKGG
jgi:CBS-domain-containing membrane protein